MTTLPERWSKFLLTAKPVTSVDVTSADILTELEQTLRASRIELQFAEVKDPVKEEAEALRAARSNRD